MDAHSTPSCHVPEGAEPLLSTQLNKLNASRILLAQTTSSPTPFPKLSAPLAQSAARAKVDGVSLIDLGFYDTGGEI